jgi:hypothetical protein
MLLRRRWRSPKELNPQASCQEIVEYRALRLIGPDIETGRHQALAREIYHGPHAEWHDRL